VHLQLPLTTATAVAATLREATTRLAAITSNPRDEAEWLLAELLGVERAALRRVEAIGRDVAQRFEHGLQRRLAGEPFAYVTGTQPFRRLTLQVTPAVLIPRTDTETLVDWALSLLAQRASPARVLDACTGSGAIALALADEAPRHAITGSDCSPAALAVARANAGRLGLPVRFIEADALALPGDTPLFDLITANPPYIAAGDAHLAALGHEPALALVSGVDGLDLIRRLIAEAPRWLAPDGWLLLEHGHDQGERVRGLLATGGFTHVGTRPDLGGNERVSGGQRG